MKNRLKEKKAYITSQLFMVDYFIPNYKSDILPSEFSKTGQITLQIVLDGDFATVARFYLFLFYLFPLNLYKIIVNHRKIIK
jgi:hypothetical protein